jgi:hypothetical protein
MGILFFLRLVYFLQTFPCYPFLFTGFDVRKPLQNKFLKNFMIDRRGQQFPATGRAGLLPQNLI